MKLLLRNAQAPGDVLVLTAAVRDLHKAHPSRFVTAVQTTSAALWENNPYVVTPRQLGSPDRTIDCEYPLVHESNVRRLHFLHGFVQDLEHKLGLPIPLTSPSGDLHLSADECASPSPVRACGHDGAYWVIVAGGKQDATTKWWDPGAYQTVVDHFAGRITFVQCGNVGDWHPRLRGVVHLVGRTGLREFVRVVYHADGVVCPVTFAMHLAAAMPPRPGEVGAKPCVVIAGGREPPHWEAYPGHRFLHTIGRLDCCAEGGCWKSRCQVGRDLKADPKLCVNPARVGEGLSIAGCMKKITPEDVIDAVESYLTDRPSPGVTKSGGSGMADDSSARLDIDVRPRGVAVTIGVGRFERLARLAARELSAKTGLDAVVLGKQHLKESGLELPAFLKFRLFDLVPAENVLYFDADMVCLEGWDPRRHFGKEAVVAVRDRMVAPVLDECTAWDVPPEEYFNAGLFFANASRHRDWLRKGEKMRFDRRTGLQDQSPLNAARRRLGIPIEFLDRRFNWLGFGASSLSHDVPVVMAHKLAPDRIDLNEAYFDGNYGLFAPTLRLEISESARLAGRAFDFQEEGTTRATVVLREDGCVLPARSVGGADFFADYWFVHVVDGVPHLAFASETAVVRQFVEVVGGAWVDVSDKGRRLLDRAFRGRPALTPENARDVADEFLASVPPYDASAFDGRGIVICAGGEKYLPPAWVTVRMLRRLGCELPIELWHLRRDEIRDCVARRFERLGVRCVNAAEVRRRHPARFLGGWELKPYAVAHSAFEQVLYLDADNAPVADPTYLFDAPEFARTGAVFWPDYGRLGPDRSIWKICRVPFRDEPEFESGQLLIDKRRAWAALQLTLHLNDHSDFYYRHIHGDKDTFHMAWLVAGHEFSQVPYPIHSLEATMCQHDFQGRRIFQHRNRAKWSVTGINPRIDGFEHEDQCFAFVHEFAEIWSSAERT